MFGQSQGNSIYLRLLIKTTTSTIFKTTCWNNFHNCCLFLYKSLSWKKIDLAISQGHNVIKILWTMVPCAIYQSSWKQNPRDKVFKAFQIILAWKPSGHVTNILISSYLKVYIQTFVKKGQVVKFSSEI